MDASELLKGLRTLQIVGIHLPTDQNTAQGRCSQVSVRFVAEQSAPAEACLEFNRPGPVDGADDDATKIASREQETLSTEHFVLVQPEAITGENNSTVDLDDEALTETVQSERLVSVTFDARCSPKELIFNTTTGAITGVFKTRRPRPIPWPRSINVLHGVCYGARKLIPGTNIALMHEGSFIRVNTEGMIYPHKSDIQLYNIFSVVMVAPGSNAVGLRFMETAGFLRCACEEGEVLAQRDLVRVDGVAPGHYCSWLEEYAGDGQIALRSTMNRKFVSTVCERDEIHYYTKAQWISRCIGLLPGSMLDRSMKFKVVLATL